MRAVVWTRYGPPEGLELADVPKPVPKEHELLIRVHATTVAAGDSELRRLRFSLGLQVVVRLVMGVTRPRRQVLGQELAGVVESVGRGVTRFRPGDRVFGTTGFGFGAYAEYICLPERVAGRALAAIPTNVSFVDAAAVPTGGLEALHFLRSAGNLRGRAVVINGAGGGIGTMAIQIAKRSGAEVTAVDRASKFERIRSLGADRVVDYMREDFTESGETYDLILDVAGTSRFSRCLRILRSGGSYCVANPRFTTVLRGLRRRRAGGRTVLVRAGRQPTEDLEQLAGMMAVGHLRAVIDRQYPLDQIREAHRYVDSGLVQGKVAVTVASPGA